MGRPLAARLYRPVLAQALEFRVDELVLEWANREMAELDVAADVTAAGRDLGAGVVDVKSYHLESADEVATRIERILAAGVPPDRLLLVSSRSLMTAGNSCRLWGPTSTSTKGKSAKNSSRRLWARQPATTTTRHGRSLFRRVAVPKWPARRYRPSP